MKKVTLLLAGAFALLTSCEKNDSSPINNGQPGFTAEKRKHAKLHLNIQGLTPLGSNGKYEGWIIVDGVPLSTGRFVIDEDGMLAPSHFNLNANDLAAASMFVLTIEPNPDSDPAPSSTHILAGVFSGNGALLSVAHPAALGNDFTSATGKFLLATPTTSSMADEDKGVWFIDNSSGMGMPGFNLPTLPAGWKYEGWTVINGQPVTTGTFLTNNVADDAAPFSGPLMGPPFPGEDYIMNAPAGILFPPDLSGAPIVLTIEPYPDNSPAPFTPLKPLVGSVPMSPSVHTTYNLSNNASTFPTGTASR